MSFIKRVIWLLLIIIVGNGAYFYLSQGSIDDPTSTSQEMTAPSDTPVHFSFFPFLHQIKTFPDDPQTPITPISQSSSIEQDESQQRPIILQPTKKPIPPMIPPSPILPVITPVVTPFTPIFVITPTPDLPELPVTPEPTISPSPTPSLTPTPVITIPIQLTSSIHFDQQQQTKETLEKRLKEMDIGSVSVSVTENEVLIHLSKEDAITTDEMEIKNHIRNAIAMANGGAWLVANGEMVITPEQLGAYRLHMQGSGFEIWGKLKNADLYALVMNQLRQAGWIGWSMISSDRYVKMFAGMDVELWKEKNQSNDAEIYFCTYERLEDAQNALEILNNGYLPITLTIP